MADLGTIQTRDVNAGTRPIDRRAENRGIDQALNVGKTVLDEGVKGAVRDDVEQAIAGELDLALADVIDSSVEPVVSVTDLSGKGLSDDQLDFAKEIRQAQSQVKQAQNSSHRQAALQRVQRIQQSARAKYGWMKDEIDTLSNRILRNDPNFTQLSVLDSAASASNTRSSVSSDYLKQLSTYSYGTDELQLGISAQHRIGSEEWLKKFEERNGWVQDRVTASREYSAKKAANNLDAFDRLDYTKRALDAPSAVVNMWGEQIHQTLKELDTVRREGTDVELADKVQSFKAKLLPEYQRQAAAHQSQIDDAFNQLWSGASTASDSYQAAVIIRDRAKADIDYFIDELTTGNMDVVDFLKAQSFIRGTRAFEVLPSIKALADMSAAGGGPEFMKSFDVVFSNTAVGQRLANAVGKDVGVLLGRLAADSLATADIADPSDLIGMLDAVDEQDENSGGLSKPKTKQQAVEDGLNLLVLPQAMLEGNPSFASNSTQMQGIAKQTWMGLHRANKKLNANPTADQDKVKEEVDRRQAHFASDVWMDGIQLLDRKDPDVMALAKTIREDYYGARGMNNRAASIDDINSIATAPAPGGIEGTMIEYLIVDTTNTDGTGRVSIRPDIAKIDAALKARPQFLTLQARGIEDSVKPDSVLGRLFLGTKQNSLAENLNPDTAIPFYNVVANELAIQASEYNRGRAGFFWLEGNGDAFDFNRAFFEQGSGEQTLASILLVPPLATE